MGTQCLLQNTIYLQSATKTLENHRPEGFYSELLCELYYISNLICYSPICIFPPGNKFRDVPMETFSWHNFKLNKLYKAYVAGWGFTQKECQTGPWGPSPTKMCKFPFIHQVIHRFQKWLGTWPSCVNVYYQCLDLTSNFFLNKGYRIRPMLI